MSAGGGLMLHSFSGDPWGPCSRCDHPAYHAIHRESPYGPGCERHKGDPHNLCPECWKLEPDVPAAAVSSTKEPA